MQPLALRVNRQLNLSQHSLCTLNSQLWLHLDVGLVASAVKYVVASEFFDAVSELISTFSKCLYGSMQQSVNSFWSFSAFTLI